MEPVNLNTYLTVAPHERPEHAGLDLVEEIAIALTIRCDDGRTSRLELARFDRESAE